jgi:DNA invertase Pin-like site-specific DNA recombinase
LLFERELIGERVRDKIAASKRKGLWVGGPVPLGYAAVDKRWWRSRPRPKQISANQLAVMLVCSHFSTLTNHHFQHTAENLGWTVA